MKIKVPKNRLTNLYNTFLTNGQLTLLGKKGKLIKVGIMETENGNLVINGDDMTKALYARLTIPVNVEKDGKYVISSAIGFYDDFLKYIDGDDLTITVGTKSITITDGKTSFSDGIKIAKIKKALKIWKETTKYKDGAVHFAEEKTGEYDYIHWFTIKDGKELKSLQDIGLKSIKTDGITLTTEGNTLTVKMENPQRAMQYETEYNVEVHSETTLYTHFLYPVLANLKGTTDFYYYLTTTGKLRIFVHNGELEWMIRYDEQQPV